MCSRASIRTRPRPGLSALMTQVETAYAMTARIQKLSLLNYLRRVDASG